MDLSLPKVSDIISVPHEDGSRSYAVILYGPDKNGVILLGVFENEYESVEQVSCHFDSLIYTYDVSILDGEWKIVGTLQLSDYDKYSRRIVRGNAWEGDTCFGAALSPQTESFPERLVAGTGAASKYLHFLIKGGTERAFFRINSKAMKALLKTLNQT